MGEAKRRALARQNGSIRLDTYAGKVHVEWDPQAAVTTLGQRPFFTEFLKVSGLCETFVDECSLQYSSPNAPDKRDIFGTLMLSILASLYLYILKSKGIARGITSMDIDEKTRKLYRKRSK
jgi:hypothetical protein